nr:MAG: ORF1 [Torque teno virus]
MVWRRRRRRWRRWPFRARRRRWRLRRARRRRAPRRFRTRRRVSRRRGRWTRRYRKWRRRRRRRRHRAKLVLKQWQPAYVVNCYIVGYMPLIYCGENTSGRNFATHSDDLLSKGPYGGGMTTTKLTLRIFYDEHLRFLNFWTKSNEDLDLCRYLGTTIILYRHPTVDFIVQIHTSPPFLDTNLTGPSIHPGMLMLTKNKIFVPSLKTRPNRKHKVKLRIRPPKLFEDKWYPQNELCDLTLFTIFATAADLQYPFGSPQTDNPCVNFQVLAPLYNGHLSIYSDKDTEHNLYFTNHLFNKIAYYNTFETIAQIKPSATQKYTNENSFSPSWDSCINKHALKPDGTNQTSCNDAWYLGKVYTNDIQTAAKNVRNKYFTATKAALPAYATLSTDLYEYHTGAYSSIFLSSGRAYFETTGAYQDIIYNPILDKGLGNKVWLDYLGKEDSVLNEKTAKALIVDLPLWAAFFGYAEFAAKTTGDGAITANTRLCIRCPYTDPMLIDRSDDNKGFVPYSQNFGKGKMPGGSSNVPISMRVKWYVMLFHQLEFMEEIVQSGPFAYKGDEKSAVLSMKYVSHWKWGGNPVHHQVVRNPCKEKAYSSRVPRGLQAVDPKHVAPPLVFHTWDYRRGFFGPASIKRMQEESEAFLFSTGPPRKRPKRDTDPQASEQEEDSLSRLRQQQLQPWIHSSQEAQSSQEEAPPQENLQDQLLQQLREQRALRLHLQHLAGEVLKVKAGYGLHPLLSSQA